MVLVVRGLVSGDWLVSGAGGKRSTQWRGLVVSGAGGKRSSQWRGLVSGADGKRSSQWGLVSQWC